MTRLKAPVSISEDPPPYLLSPVYAQRRSRPCCVRFGLWRGAGKRDTKHHASKRGPTAKATAADWHRTAAEEGAVALFTRWRCASRSDQPRYPHAHDTTTATAPLSLFSLPRPYVSGASAGLWYGCGGSVVPRIQRETLASANSSTLLALSAPSHGLSEGCTVSLPRLTGVPRGAHPADPRPRLYPSYPRPPDPRPSGLLCRLVSVEQRSRHGRRTDPLSLCAPSVGPPVSSGHCGRSSPRATDNATTRLPRPPGLLCRWHESCFATATDPPVPCLHRL